MKIVYKYSRICKHCNKEFICTNPMKKYCSNECQFLDKLKRVSSGCIEWQGSRNIQNYGIMRINSKAYPAHRFSWERLHGPIPKDLIICHKCDNPCCVNPEHLFLGTKYDNNHDRSLKGRSGKRTYSPEEKKRYSQLFSGENNSTSRLTNKQVEQIITLKGQYSYSQIAKMFNISKCTITSIFNGRAWNIVTGLPNRRRKKKHEKSMALS